MSLNKNNSSIQDYEEIMSVISNYAESLRSGNVEQLQKSFHQDAIMYGHWEGHLISGSINNLYDSVAKYGAAPNLKVHIDVLHKTVTTALVRMEYERNAAEKDGTDYHSLIEIDGQWKVISKLFEIPKK